MFIEYDSMLKLKLIVNYNLLCGCQLENNFIL